MFCLNVNVKILNNNRLLACIIGLLVIVLFSFLFRNLRLSEMWAFGDLSAFPKDTSVIENWTFYAWSSQGLGFLSFKPFTYYIEILVSTTLLGNNIAQKFMFLLLPIFSFVTFFCFLRKLKVNLLAAAVGSLLYAVNPVTISEFIGGSMTLAAYATFPLILLFIIRVLERKQVNISDLIILGLLAFFVLNVHATFWYTVIIIPAIVSLFFVNKLRPIEATKRFTRFFIPLLIALLIIFPNTLGYIGLYGSNARTDTSFVSDTVYCYSDSQFYNIIRLAGNKGSVQAEEYLNYNTLNNYAILGYAIPLIAFIPLFIKKRETSNLTPLIMTMVLAFLIGFSVIFILRTFPSIVDLHPIFASLRNPVKLLYPIAFSLCLLFTVGIQKIIATFQAKRNSRVLKLLVASLIVTVILSYNYPALDGTLGVGVSNIRGEDYYIKEKYVELPLILEKLDKNYNNYRVMIVPWELSTLERISSYVPNYFGMPPGSAISSNTTWLQEVFEYITSEASVDRGALLGIFQVKYVVIDKTFTSLFDNSTVYKNLMNGKSNSVYRAHDSFWISGNPTYYIELFKEDYDFSTAYQDDNFIIFKNHRAQDKMHIRDNMLNLSFSTDLGLNLIKNPSFESGLEYWQFGPANLVNITNSAGNQAIVLVGQRDWFTECLQAVSVQEESYYQLTFFIKSYNTTDMHAKVLWFNITEIDKIDNYCQVDYIQPAHKEETWMATKKLLSPSGAKTAVIWFGANRLENFTDTTLQIDDIEFQRVEKVLINNDQLLDIKAINYSKINPTKFQTTLNLTSPCVLAFSETYDPSWVCYANGKLISSSILYDSINGFYIDQVGLVELTIEYEPQKLFSMACIISLATISFCVIFLIVWYTKRFVANLASK